MFSSSVLCHLRVPLCHNYFITLLRLHTSPHSTTRLCILNIDVNISVDFQTPSVHQVQGEIQTQ